MSDAADVADGGGPRQWRISGGRGAKMFGAFVDRALAAAGFDQRTSMYVRFDLRRLYARVKHHHRQLKPDRTKLHLGCGQRVVTGWLNCDIAGSEFDIDLAASSLPFVSDQFTTIVAQQVIEHLEFDPAGLRLLRECHRILKPGGEIWLSCPDLEKMCLAYVSDRCRTLDQGLKRHSPAWRDLPDFPVQHRINYYFHQGGEHRNLMDFEMLQWALVHARFRDVKRAHEAELLAAHPEFPPHNDEFESVLVVAVK
jgi:predicted SAM-dependent methyltransferase